MQLKKNEKIMLISLLILILALFILVIVELNNIGNKASDNEVTDIIVQTGEQTISKTTGNDYDNMINSCQAEVYSDKETKSSDFSITSTIYCNDLVMVNFIDSDGNSESITATITRDEETSEISTINSDNIYSLENFNEYNSNSKLYDIGNIIINIAKSDKNTLNDIDTENYFTDAGYNDLIANINEDVKVDNVDISFMKIGKSDLNLEYYDRIIAQIVTNDTSTSVYTNIIIKLDKDGKIFDIDII